VLGGLFIAATLLLPAGIVGTYEWWWDERHADKKTVALPASAPHAAE